MATLISVDGPLAVTQPIVMEVVARRHADAVLAFDVDIDRICRAAGVPLDPASLRAE